MRKPLMVHANNIKITKLHVQWLKIGRIICAVEIPPEEQGVSPHFELHSPDHQSQKEEIA